MLVSVPFIALLYTSWGLLTQLQSKLDDTSSFESLSALALSSSALVHELQKERGSSAGFLSSEGRAFKEILAAQRPLTDARLVNFNDQLAKVDVSSYSEAFEANISELLSLLLSLDRNRSLVSSISISVAEEVAYYTELNTRLLNISDSLARFSPGGELANSSAAFATFLQSKERAGIERAVMSSVFAKDSFSKVSFDKFNNLVNTQNIYLSVFNDMANTSEKEFYDTQMNHQSVRDVDQMRSIAFSNAETGGFDVDAEHWFRTITQKINLLKSVENYLGENVHAQAIAVRQETSNKLMEFTVVITAASFFSLLLVLLITHAVDSSISKAVKLAKAIAAGDLTRDYQSVNRDEAGQLLDTLNSMQNELNRVIGASHDVSESVAAGAEQISLSSTLLSRKTQEQSNNIETTASSTEEISITIKQNAEFAKEAQKVSKEASEEAEHGGVVVHNAVQAMEEINEASRKIASITGVIDEIAFQTNLLALNAAVEAARAGDHGKGFAIVASEVRKLAGRSAEAAKEIKALIEDSVEKVEGGARYVGESGCALNKIVASVKSLNHIMSDISNASQEQALGVDTINESMVHMSTITRDNEHIAKEVTLAGNTIAHEAASLSNSLSFFRLKTTPSSQQKAALHSVALNEAGHAISANDETLDARVYDKAVSGL